MLQSLIFSEHVHLEFELENPNEKMKDEEHQKM